MTMSQHMINFITAHKHRKETNFPANKTVNLYAKSTVCWT